MGKRVIIYRRISTNENNQRHSLGHQKDVLEQFCKLNGYEIVLDVFEEHSAKTFERPKWQNTMEFLRKNRGLVDAILVLRWDRFARNVEFALTEIRKLSKLGVEILTVEQQLDLNNPDSKILLALYLSVGEVENDKNTIRTTEASRKARLKGYWTGTAPFGYKNHRNALDQSTLIPGENAGLVREVFEEMSRGIYQADSLRKKYLSLGHKLPCKQGFLDMLRNVAYIGKVAVQKYKDQPYEEAEGLHDAIVDESTFYKVQNILKKGKRKATAFQQEQDNYSLKGSLVCPEYNHHMVAYKTTKPNGKEYSYYECQKCKIRHSVDKLHTEFVKYLSGLRINKEVLNLYLEMVKEELDKQDSDRMLNIRKLKEKISDLDKLLENMKYKLATNEVTSQVYGEVKATIERDRLNALLQKEDIENQKPLFKHYLEYAIKLLPQMANFFNNTNGEVRKLMVSSIFPEKIVFENNTYRTANPNSLLSLLSLNINDLRGAKSKKVGNKSDQSTLAPPPRLERGTP